MVGRDCVKNGHNMATDLSSAVLAGFEDLQQLTLIACELEMFETR